MSSSPMLMRWSPLNLLTRESTPTLLGICATEYAVDAWGTMMVSRLLVRSNVILVRSGPAPLSNFKKSTPWMSNRSCAVNARQGWRMGRTRGNRFAWPSDSHRSAGCGWRLNGWIGSRRGLLVPRIRSRGDGKN